MYDEINKKTIAGPAEYALKHISDVTNPDQNTPFSEG
jgi:hypothetical protein